MKHSMLEPLMHICPVGHQRVFTVVSCELFFALAGRFGASITPAVELSKFFYNAFYSQIAHWSQTSSNKFPICLNKSILLSWRWLRVVCCRNACNARLFFDVDLCCLCSIHGYIPCIDSQDRVIIDCQRIHFAKGLKNWSSAKLIE